MKRFFQIVVAFGIAGVLLLVFFFDPAKNLLFPQCLFHEFTGYYCPGCGSQRALHDMLHLNFAGTAANNILFIPAGILIAYHWIRQFLFRKAGVNLPDVLYKKATPWIIFAVILLFGILRNLSYYPFQGLAPGL